jgi:hypothetical protein
MSQESLAKKKGIADIVFLLDVSGSMSPCVKALKDNIGILIDTMVNPGPNAPAVVKDWRIKIAGYSDVRADGAEWWQEFPFSNDVAQVKADLAALALKGGGDEPESLLDGLWKLATMRAVERSAMADGDSWRHRNDAARVVVVFTDASCPMTTVLPEAGGATFDDVVRDIQASKLRISLFSPEADCYQQFGEIDGIEIEFVGSLSDSVEHMKEYTSNVENFKRTLEQLGKSISVSAATVAL